MNTVENTTFDPTIHFSDLTIKDKTYKLCWDFNALATAEDMTGTNLLSGIGAVLDGRQSATQIRALLFAALLVAQPSTTVKDAGKLIRLDTLADIVTAIGNAYKVSMRDPDDEKKTEPEVTPEPASN